MEIVTVVSLIAGVLGWTYVAAALASIPIKALWPKFVAVVLAALTVVGHLVAALMGKPWGWIYVVIWSGIVALAVWTLRMGIRTRRLREATRALVARRWS